MVSVYVSMPQAENKENLFYIQSNIVWSYLINDQWCISVAELVSSKLRTCSADAGFPVS